MKVEISKEEYELILEARKPKIIMKNEYVINENYAEMIIRDKFFYEKKRVKVDIEDIQELGQVRWYYGANGYIMGHVKERTNITLHKFITKTGRLEFIDHINCDRMDNRKSNLRLCTQQQNNYNTGTPKTNKSGHRGIRIAKSGRYLAYITKDKKQRTLGTFDTFEEAKEERLKAEKLYFGEYAYKGI